MNKLDAWIITVFEYFCHKFQRLTGRTNYWIAGMLAYIFSAFVALFLIATFTHTTSLAKNYAGVVSKTWLIVMIYMYYRQGVYFWKVLEEQAFTRLNKGLSNPKKINPVSILRRYVFLSLFILALYALYSRKSLDFIHFALPFMWADEYLLTCDPLPPCAGKIQEFLARMFTKLVPANASSHS